MISKCISLALDTALDDVVNVEPSLHQLDIKGEGTGVFEAGWRYSTYVHASLLSLLVLIRLRLHHWASWFTLMPKTNPYVPSDDVALVGLLGKAARAVGPQNWGRRYVFRRKGDEGEIQAVLALGYSLTTYRPGVINATDLAKVERTFELDLLLPMRPPLREGPDRRTYFLCKSFPRCPLLLLIVGRFGR